MNTISQYTIFSKFLSLVQSHSPYGLNLKIYRCMYHRIPHNFLSFIFYVTSIYHGLLLVFWKGFPCSFFFLWGVAVGFIIFYLVFLKPDIIWIKS